MDKQYGRALLAVLAVLAVLAPHALIVLAAAVLVHFLFAFLWGRLCGAIATSTGLRKHFVQVNISDGNFTWILNNEATKAYRLPKFALVFAYLAEVFIMWYFLEKTMTDMGPIEGDFVTVLAWLAYLALTGAANAACMGIASRQASLVIEKLDEKLRLAAADVKALEDIDRSIEETCAKEQIRVTANYTMRFSKHAQEHQARWVDFPEEIKPFADQLLAEANEELAAMTKAVAAYRDVMQSFRNASREANRVGVATLIAELQGIHEALSSDNLVGLLQNRSYEDFDQICVEAKADLDRIAGLAPQLDRSRPEAWQAGPVESEIDKARAIFGVAATASLKEIKKIFASLSKEFHPDHSERATVSVRKLAEEKFKDVNWAYDILKQHHTA